MEKETGQVAEPQQKDIKSNKKPRKKRRWFLWFLATLLSLVLLFQVVFFFYADQIFGRLLKEVVHQSSDKVYSMTYEKVIFNVLRNEMEFTELAIRSDSTVFFSNENKNFKSNKLIDFYTPHLSIKGPSILKLYFDKVLRIQDFELLSPHLSVRIYGNVRKGKGGFRNFHEVITEYISFLKIKSLSLGNGEVEITKIREGKHKKISIHEISTEIDGFVLNEKHALDSLLALDNLSLTLGRNEISVDSLSQLEFASLAFSTKDSTIFIQRFGLVHRVKITDRNVPEFVFNSFDLKGVDFAEIYFNNNFMARSVDASEGEATYAVLTKPDSMASWQKINKWFDTIAIQQIRVDQTQVHYIKKIGRKNPDLTLPINQLVLKKFLIDSTQFFTRRKEFYAKQTELTLDPFSIFSKDGAHEIWTESLQLSSLRRELLLFNVKIKSLKNLGKARINGDIRSIQFFGIDPLIALQDNEIKARAVLVENPEIKLQSGKKAGNGLSNALLNSMIKKQFRTVTIENVEIENGQLDVANAKGVQLVKAEGIQFFGTNFSTFSTPPSVHRPLLTEWFNAELTEIYFRFPDDLHFLQMDGFKAFSKEDGFYTKELLIGLKEGVSDSFILGKNVIRRAHFHELVVENFNYNAFLSEGILDIGYLESKGKNVLEASLQDTSSTSQTLIHRIKIDEMTLDSLDAKFQIGLDQNFLFKTDAMRLQTCDFLWDSSFTKGRFQSYSTLLEGRNLFCSHGASNHLLKAKKIKLNSSYDLFQLNDVDLRPIGDKLNGKNALWFQSTKTQLGDVDLSTFFSERILNAGSFYASKPSITFHSFGEGRSSLAETLASPQTLLSDQLEKITIGTIRLLNGGIDYMAHREDKEIHYVLDDLLFIAEKFNLDTTTIHTDSNVLFSQTSHIEFKSFEQSANDSSLIFAIDGGELFLEKKRGTVQNLSIKNRFPPEHRKHFAFSGPEVAVEGLNVHDLLVEKRINLQKAKIKGAVLKLGLGGKKGDAATFFQKTLPEVLTKNYESVHADTLLLTQSELLLRYRDETRKVRTEAIGKWQIQSLGFDINRGVVPAFLYSKGLSAKLKNYHKKWADSLNISKISSLEIDITKNRITLDSFELQPRYSKALFGLTYGKQIDRIEVLNIHSRLEGVDFQRLLYKGEAHIKTCLLGVTKINVHTDKTLGPDVAKIKKMPQEALQEFGLPLQIDFTRLSGWDITYEEKVSSMDPGRISFHDFGANISCFSNMPFVADTCNTQLKVKSELMKQGKVKLRIDIPLAHPDDMFNFKGSVNNMDMREINPLLNSLALIDITRGRTYGMEFNGSADRYFATGEMDFRYSKLKVRVLDADGNSNKVKNRLISIIANRFVIKSNNRVFPKIGKIDFTRDEHKSIFNYGAKSLLTGIKETIGLKNK